MEKPLDKPPASPARGTGPPDPDYPEPSAKAEVFLILESTDDPSGESHGAGGTGSQRTKKLRRLGPFKLGMRITVPPGETGQMLRTLERTVLGGTWAVTVTGTLIEAPAAHLPPAATVTTVVLEILAPAVAMCIRRRNSSKDN